MTITFFTRKNGSRKSLYVRLTYKAQSTEVKLDFNMNDTSVKSELYKRQVDRELRDIYNQQLLERLPVDPQTVKAIYLSKNKARYLLETYTEYINNKLKPRVAKGEITDRALQKYEATFHHLQDFLKIRGMDDINIMHVTPALIDDFDGFIRQFNAHNSTMKHLSYFKCIMTYAVDVKGYIMRNPFTGIKLAKKKTRPIYLEHDELLKIMNKKHLHERLEKIRDLFLFQCFTGLSYADMYHLTEQKIHQDYIKINRQKSKEQALIYLYEIPKLLLKKYNNQLPLLSNAKYNAYLKELAVITNIDKKLTTHVARHTFATTVNLNNGVPLEVVSAMLGHTSVKMTEHYAKLKSSSVLNSCTINSTKLNQLYSVEQMSMFFTTLAPVSQNQITSQQKPSHG